MITVCISTPTPLSTTRQLCGTRWVSCNSAQLQPHLPGETPGPTGEGLLPDRLSSEVLGDPSSGSINSLGQLRLRKSVFLPDDQCVTSDINIQMKSPVKRYPQAGSGRVPNTGASVPGEFGVLPPQKSPGSAAQKPPTPCPMGLILRFHHVGSTDEIISHQPPIRSLASLPPQGSEDGRSELPPSNPGGASWKPAPSLGLT